MSVMDKSVFESVFSGFSPTGWTAIGGSLRKSADVFAGKEGQNNHVIVISDGIETCDSNPTEAARELKALSINPQIDVIGLAVDTATKAQLEEVAKIGGGTYKPANSAVELEDALKKKVDLVEYKAIKPALKENILSSQSLNKFSFAHFLLPNINKFNLLICV